MPEKKPAAAAAAAKKSQAKPPVSFNHEIDLITSVNTRNNSSYSDFGIPQGQMQMQMQRRAMDYQPPDSFIQNLEKPGPGREQRAKGNVLADLWS